jgi:hypothetical protein
MALAAAGDVPRRSVAARRPQRNGRLVGGRVVRHPSMRAVFVSARIRVMGVVDHMLEAAIDARRRLDELVRRELRDARP